MIRAVAYTGASCSSARCAAVVSVDDGTSETGGSGGAGATIYYVSRLTPTSYPATLTGVRIYTPFTSVTGIKVLSAANPSGNSNINNTNFSTKTASTPAIAGFADYPVDPITIYSGDFIVGYSAVQQSTATIALDTTPPLQGRSYYGNGTNFTLDSGVNYLIRAVLFSNTCSIGNCSYVLTTTLQNPVSGEGGGGIITITTQPGCPWRIARRNEWLSVNVANGSGTGTVAIGVTLNHSAIYRSGSLVVGPPTGYLPADNLFGNNLSKSFLLEDDTWPEGEELVVEQEALAPSAASVSVGGRVTDSVGRAIGGVTVTMTDRNGENRTARTNPFGYYAFTEVLAGETYVFTLSAKRYRFSQSPLIRTIGDEAANVDFIADN